MVVVVTRPDPEGSELCQDLWQQKVSAIHFPLITFSQGDGEEELLSLLSKADIIIAVSKQSVLWADKILQDKQKNWPLNSRYLAIGQKTAEKLSSVCQQEVCYPDVSDSEHFLQLDVLNNVKNKRVVILRGNGGRELICSTLKKRQASVEYCEVYRRHKRAFNGNSILSDWQQKKVTHIVATSGEQLEHLVEQMPNLQWLCQQIVIVPSKRIACLASELGFNNVLVSGSASNPDLLAATLPQSITGQAHDK